MEAGREEVGYEPVQLPDSGFAVVEPRAVERWGVSGWEAAAEWVINRGIGELVDFGDCGRE